MCSPAAPATQADDATRQQNTHHAVDYEDAINDDSNIFEFFDLQNAALDPDSPQLPQAEPEPMSITSSVTLCANLPQHVTPDVPEAEREYSQPTSTTVALPSLYHVSAGQEVSDDIPRSLSTQG